MSAAVDRNGREFPNSSNLHLVHNFTLALVFVDFLTSLIISASLI